MQSIRIVLAEDHALMREGTRHVLERHPDLVVVGEAEDGITALSLIQRLKPDVAIVDMRMPGKNGIEVAREIQSQQLETRLLVLTAYDDPDYVVEALEAGAKGYLLKTARAAEVVQAIRQVHDGETVLQPVVAGRVTRMLIRQRQSDAEGAVAESLTPRELKVLALASEGLRNRDIADKLSVSIRTVEGYFSSILSKLDVQSRTAAVMHAAARGWLDRDSAAGSHTNKP